MKQITSVLFIHAKMDQCKVLNKLTTISPELVDQA